MDKFQLKTQFSESTTKVGYQLNHIWANVPRNECKYSVTKKKGTPRKHPQVTV